MTEIKGNFNIQAEEVIIGQNVTIQDGVSISGIYDKPCRRVVIGDNCFIGKETLILTPEFTIGDFGTIHKKTRISGAQACRIGHNFWIDQNCVMNCADLLTVGNNVGIGAYSQLWTHIKYGDVLEGCRFNSTKPMTLEDDVWFVGHCVVSPIVARHKSVAMLGSVVTKDMEANHVYGGCPAVDLTAKIGAPYVERTVDEKRSLMEAQKRLFFETTPDDADQIEIVTTFPTQRDGEVTYFNVSTRTYTKRGTEVEVAFMKHLLPLHKFTPSA